METRYRPLQWIHHMTRGNAFVPSCWMGYDSTMSLTKTMGTLRSDDSDDNENVIRAIGLKSKTTTLPVYHTFLYSSLPFFHDYDVKKA